MGAFDLQAVAQAFATAAVDPSRWERAMEVAGTATGSCGALLVPVRGQLPGMPFSASIGSLVETYISDGWIHRDIRYEAMPAIQRRGAATDLDVMSPEKIARHPYYQEFMGRHGFQWFAGILVDSGDDQWVLAIQRLREEGPFSPQEISELAALSRQLGGAAATARAFGFARVDAAMQAFEVSDTAVVMLDRVGEVVRANAAADRILTGDPRIERRRLVSRDAEATATLDRALHGLIWNRSKAALMSPVRLPRQGRRPLLAYPVRLPAVSADIFTPCQALLVLVDPEKQKAPPEAALRDGFGLTAAEARLAMRLASGVSLETAAESLHVSKETARVQLKAIFGKLDVHRQAEMVALVARLLGPAR